MTSADVQLGTIAVVDIGGYDEMVTLAVGGLPAGVSAIVDLNPVLPGEKATLTLTTAGAPLGDYEVMINGNSSSAAHERPFRLAVVERVYDMVFPLVAR